MLDKYPDILTVHDLMDIFHISQTSAYRFVKSGRVKTMHIGCSVRITKQSVMEFIDSDSNNDMVE